MKTGIIERMWQLGVGMLTGWVVLDLFLLAVLRSGGTIQTWHGVVWIGATFFGVSIVTGGQRTGGRGRAEGAGIRIMMKMKEVLGLGTGGLRTKSLVGGRRQAEDGRRKTEGGNQRTEGIWHPASGIWGQVGISSILTCIAVLLPLAFSWVMGHFTDFSWDGMTSRGITVRNLMTGQPPMVEMSFGHVTAGFLAKLTGGWQGAKGINLTFILISFCLVLGSLHGLGLQGWSGVCLALLAALNPVAVYQTSCFQIDGHVASLFCCFAFVCLQVWSQSGRDPKGWFVLIIAFLGLSLSKISAFFYAISVLLPLLFPLLVSRKISHRIKKVIVGGFFMLLLSGTGLVCLLHPEKISLSNLKKYSDIQTVGWGVGGGAARVQEYINLPKPVLFAASAFSMTEGSPEKINLKPPFWTTRREIRIFEDLFPDPRAGGFGPFYSTAFLLAGLGCLGLLAAGKWKYAPGWFLVLASFGSSYFSQIWWARWTPQNWLLVIGMLMPLVAYGFGSSRSDGWRGLRVEGLKGLESGGLDGEEVQRLGGWKGTWVRSFAVLGMIAAFLNVGIIALYYGIGMVRQERILDSQMHVAAQLRQPLPIYLQKEDFVFIASKYWLEERGIQTREVPENVEKPRIKLNRTHTRFPLPENWRSLLRRPEDEKVLRERGLIED